MAFLSAIFSLLARKLGDIAQAVFGWSITALFGRLSSTREAMLTVALVMSLVWPLFVVGVFFPAAAAWALAFLPLERWVSAAVLRGVWIALAVIAPAVVGLLTRFAAAPEQRKGGALNALVQGYPITLGFAISFLLTVVTVPIVKVSSAARGWSDTHAFVQARVDRYDAVLRDVAEACARAGYRAEIVPVPGVMALSTRVMKRLARGAVDTFVAADPRMLRAEGLELYLYPADLLLRGEPKRVSRVRAMLTRTAIDRDAYLVEAPRAQALQDELGRMWDVAARHEAEGTEAGSIAAARLREIYRDMNRADIGFDDWVTLERILRRIERRLFEGPTVVDEAETSLAEVADEANEIPRTFGLREAHP